MQRWLVAAVIFASSSASALDCSTPPTSGFGGADYRAYAEWCTACGGTPSSANGVSCAPGPNWGKASQGGSAAPSGDFLLDLFSGGAYSTERKLAQAKVLNRQALEQWAQSELVRRREIFDRVAGEMKLGEEAVAAYVARATGAPQSAEGNPFRKQSKCAVSPDGKIRPDRNQAVCNTFSCGGSDGAPLCCPDDYPLLNQCDCQCYKSSSDFSCARYMACQHYKANP